ncbi:MAG TPA: hypothetical protein VNO23_11410 [Candidatus Binatia bacterium]|nr:hypothetical protein [Candidatus Binatia bacterium]
MSRGKSRDFWCDVVSERVQIRLRRWGGFGRPPGYFVQCNQTECQYVEENKPPCPLHIGMFADEIRTLEAERARRAAERM